MGTFNDISSIFSDIGNALRSKMGTSDTFTPNSMAPAIINLQGVPFPEPKYIKNFSSEGVVGILYGQVPVNNVVVEGPYGNATINYDYTDTSINAVDIWEVTSAVNLFRNNTNNFSQYDEIYIGNNVTNMANMFMDAQYFNKPITIPNSVTNVYNMFQMATSFNQPVIIGNNVVDASSMFRNARRFNQPVIIPNSVTNTCRMFASANNFNQPVIIGNNVVDASSMFASTPNFNQPITIPNSVTNIQSMLGQALNFNQPIIIGNSVTAMSFFLYEATNFGQSIYFCNSSAINNVQFMFFMCNNSLKKNIYCNNARPFLANNYSSIVMDTITWDTLSDGNGYYNTTYNIYIYNNWTPT